MKEYWCCFIGPVDSELLPSGSDFPLRIAVSNAFEKLTNVFDFTTRSGFGVSKEMVDIYSKLDHLRFMGRPEFEKFKKEILEIKL